MTTTRILQRGDLPRERWDAVAERSPSAWVWHTSSLIDALATWSRYADRSFAVADDKGTLLALMPLHRVADRALGTIKACRLSSTGGPALAEGIGSRARREAIDAVTQALDDLMEREGAAWTEAIVSPMTPCLREGLLAPNPLAEYGFADASHTTWVVDLAGEESAIESAYSQLTRRQLRKAAEEPFTIRPAHGVQDCETYYALHGETCRRTGAAALPPGYMEIVFRDLVPLGLSRILFLERGGEVVAAQNTGLWKGGAVYWSGASRDDRGGGDNRLLFDAQIKASRRAGCRFYETGQAYPATSDAKEKGLSDFKASFGSRLAAFPAGRRYSTSRRQRLLTALRIGRSVIRTGKVVPS